MVRRVLQFRETRIWSSWLGREFRNVSKVGQWALQHFATYFRGWIWEMRPQRSQGTSLVYRGIHHSWIIQNQFAFWFQIIDYQNTSYRQLWSILHIWSCCKYSHNFKMNSSYWLLIRGIQPSAAGLWNGVPNSERIHPWWCRVNSVECVAALLRFVVTCPGSHVFTWNTKPFTRKKNICVKGDGEPPEHGADFLHFHMVLWKASLLGWQALSIAYTVHQEAGWAAACSGVFLHEASFDGFTTITYGGFMGV